VDTLTVEQVCTEILSITGLAFLAGGLNAVYQIEKLPLMVAMLIHGGVLYAAYLVTYLINSWLELGIIPILVFTCIFVAGYFLIWAVIHAIVKRNTARVNAMLKQKQQKTENR
jgi:cytochrome c oxidase assembly factor CtaG